MASASQARTPSPLPWVARAHPKPAPVQILATRPKVPAGPTDIVGAARALSGDTLMVGVAIFRLWGIAAPDMAEFGGYTSMQALTGKISDQTVVCAPAGLTMNGTRVARCHVGDTDLSAVMVAGGFARDCPRQSAGTYAALERQAIVDVAGGFALPAGCVADQ